MADRERVMKELSWLIYNFPQQKDPKNAADKMCNAINTYCSDALSLLKEQEPRVLTPEEIRSGAVEVAWVEDRDKVEVIPGIWFRLSNEGEDEAVDIHIRDGFVGARLAVYGKLWRCWTSCPTEEQRKEAAWDGL